MVNTLLRGRCSDFDPPAGRAVLAVYLMTHTREDPCPYHSYCGCWGTCGVPQVFLADLLYSG